MIIYPFEAFQWVIVPSTFDDNITYFSLVTRAPDLHLIPEIGNELWPNSDDY